MSNIQIAVVYSSRYGHTERQAQFIAAGAQEIANVNVELFNVKDLESPDLLNQADAIIWGSPTYNGSVSSELKAFWENTNQVWISAKWDKKITGGFVNSGSLSGDKLFAIQQICLFTMQHGMIWVGMSPLDNSQGDNSGSPDKINRVGLYMGASATSDNLSPLETPPAGDLETARLYGKRIAAVCKQYKLAQA